MSHEQSVGMPAQNGPGEQLYYGPGPSKGLSIPLDNTVYKTPEDSDAVAVIRSLFGNVSHPSTGEVVSLSDQGRANARTNATMSDAQSLLNYANNPTPGNMLSGPLGTAVRYGQSQMEAGQGTDRGPAWQMATITNKEHPLAKFAEKAYPRMYKYMDRPQSGNWEFGIGNSSYRGAGQVPPQYDMVRQRAGGLTTVPWNGETGKILVRQDLWNQMKAPGAPLDNVSVLGHELNHAVQYAAGNKTGLMAPITATQKAVFHDTGKSVNRAAQMSETATRSFAEPMAPNKFQRGFQNAQLKGGDKAASEWAAKATQSDKGLKQAVKFAEGYKEGGGGLANREVLTEAAGRTATRQAQRTGNWAAAQNEVRNLIVNLFTGK